MAHGKVLTHLVLISGFLAACSSDDSTPGSGSGGSTGTGGGGASGTSIHSDASTGDAEVASDASCVHPKGASCNPDGGYRCPAYATDICDNTCVDRNVNPDFCGTCTTKCPATATCNAGKCGASPTVFVASSPGCDTMHLALANATVYWADKGHGTIKGMPTAGGAAVILASTQGAPTQLVVDTTNAYWINSANKTVMKAPVGGGAPTVLFTSEARADAGIPAAPEITAIAVSSATVYLATAYGKMGADNVYGILKVPSAGGAAVLVGLAQQNGIPRALAVDAVYAYYTTESHNDVEFMNVAAAGDAGIGFNARDLDDLSQKNYRVAESQGSLFYDNIVVLGTSVYWANGGTLMGGKADGLRKGTSIGTTANSGPVTGFGIGASNAYFGEDGYVEMSPLASGDAGDHVDGISIARGQPNPSSFAVDPTTVYWATGASAVGAGDAGADPNACAIMKLPL
jgi:hypothetical protein